MIEIKIEVEDCITTVSYTKKEPIKANDVALAITELETLKLNLLDLYDDFERVISINDKP